MRRVCRLIVFVVLTAGCSAQSAPASTVPATAAVTASSSTMPTTVASSTLTSLVPSTTPPVGSELITATGKPVPTFISDKRFYCGFLGDKVYLRRDYDYFVKAHPVIAAVVIGDMGELRRLLNSGDNSDDLDEPYAVSALTAAIQSDCDEAIDLLLEDGADPGLSAAGDYTPVMWAVKRHNHDVLRRLVDAGADITTGLVSRHGQYLPIIEATGGQDLVAMGILVDAGADVNQATYGGTTTAIQTAVAADWLEGVEFLTEAGAGLHVAAYYTFEDKDPVLLRYLMDHGATTALPDWATGPGGPCIGTDILTACFDIIWLEGAAILREYGD